VYAWWLATFMRVHSYYFDCLGLFDLI